MKPEALKELLSNLAASVKPPTGEQIAVLLESIAFNRLTDPEILRAYHASRDESQYFPRPSEFLARARPPVSSAVVDSEANRLFDVIRDNRGMAYGRYSPEIGVIRERKRIEDAHGRAAGLAFVAAGGASAFGGMTDKSEPWVRKAFAEAYEAARADHGAPLTLDPARLLTSGPVAVPLLSGDAEPKGEGEHLRRFRELIRGFREPGGPRPDAARIDPAARVAELRRQAEELRGGA